MIAVIRAHAVFMRTCITNPPRKYLIHDEQWLARVASQALEKGFSDLSVAFFGTKQVGHGLTSPYEARRAAFDQNLGRARTRVVVGTLSHAIRAGIEQSEQVAWTNRFELAIAGEEISGFAHGTDDVDGPCFA